ncbi:MAG: ABC transporter permease [bacterium]
MLRYTVRRLALIGISLLVLSLLVFMIMEVLPGDVARVILGLHATEQQAQALRVQLGLDKPPHIRYWLWLRGVLTGDLGESLSLHAPIGPVLARRTAHSLLLGLPAAVIGLPLAILQGFIAGLRRPPWLGHLLSTGAVIISSFPRFLIAMFLILLLSETAGWFPGSSIVETGSPLHSPRILVLPLLSLVLSMTAYNLRITRASVVKVLDAEFVVAAELKQLPLHTVLWRHVAPNALLPTVTVVAGYLGWLIGGLVIIESIFTYPGLGLLIYTAAKARDVPLLEAAVLATASFRMIANLAADLLYGVLDPRVRFS